MVEPAGSDTFIVTTLAGTELTARVRGDFKQRVGSRVTLAIDLEKLNFFDCQTGARLDLSA